MLRSAISCSCAIARIVFALEQMSESLLRLQIIGDRDAMADLAAARDHAVFGLVHREEAAFDRQTRQADRVWGRPQPSGQGT